MGMLDYAMRKRTRVRLLAGEAVHWVMRSRRARYIRSVIVSTPAWVTNVELRALQEQARWVSEMSGVPHVHDHIVPLSHPRVCGLTVPWNIAIIPAQVNGAKSNRWCPEQMEMW